MKIAIASDVHLEFGQLEIENTEQAEVLCLCGDICVAHDLFDVEDENMKSKSFHEFFQQCAKEFPHVLYIMGNHEHYHGDFAESAKILRERLAYLPNLHLLDGETFDIGDVTFFGHTLWTDMNRGDEDTLCIIKNMMNDFRIIRNGNNMVYHKVQDFDAIGYGYSEYYLKKAEGANLPPIPMKTVARAATFTPEDAIAEHKKALETLGELIASRPYQKFVVMAHHSPSKRSTKPQYESDVLMNGGYSSDLDDFIADNPEIVVWMHGHTHHAFDYMVGDTRVICNPRGYINYELEAANFKLMYADV